MSMITEPLHDATMFAYGTGKNPSRAHLTRDQIEQLRRDIYRDHLITAATDSDLKGGNMFFMGMEIVKSETGIHFSA